MFVRNIDKHEDLRRIRLGTASVEDLHAWVKRAPEEILKSQAMGPLSLEDPGAWRDLITLAVDGVAKQKWTWSTSYIGYTAQDFIVQSRALWVAAKEEFGPEMAMVVLAAIQNVFTAQLYPASFFPVLENMVGLVADMIPEPMSVSAEKVAIVCHMKGHEVPAEIRDYVHPWKKVWR